MNRYHRALVALFCVAFALQAYVILQIQTSDIAFRAMILLASGLVDAATMRLMLKALNRSQATYTADVTELLEASLAEYRELTEQTSSLTQEVGLAVDRQISQARVALREGDESAVEEHLRSGIEIASGVSLPDCDNVVVAAVLESKRRQCAESDIPLIAQVNLPEDLSIEPLELASVFFNLIDIATHECRALASIQGGDPGENPSPAIEVRSFVRAGQLFVEVRNPCRKGADQQRREAARNADPTLFHGLGTGIVADIATRHGGIAQFDEEDGVMTASVLIPL